MLLLLSFCIFVVFRGIPDSPFHGDYLRILYRVLYGVAICSPLSQNQTTGNPIWQRLRQSSANLSNKRKYTPIKVVSEIRSSSSQLRQSLRFTDIIIHSLCMKQRKDMVYIVCMYVFVAAVESDVVFGGEIHPLHSTECVNMFSNTLLSTTMNMSRNKSHILMWS